VNFTDEMISEIKTLYAEGESLRGIARSFGTNHKAISKLLKTSGVELRLPLNLRGVRKFKCNNELRYNNMQTHLRFKVDLQWLMLFEDFEKLKLLNDVITNRGGRWGEDENWYKGYIEKFYHDKQFNNVYSKWKTSNYQHYKKPSIDHIIAKSVGGTNCLDNLQFLSWFENRCKSNMSQIVWDNIKDNIEEYFV